MSLNKINIEKLAIGACVAILAINTLAILAQPNRAIEDDLGRHIKLGEIIWQTKSVPYTNLFSYTHPDFPFVNHHWLSEVILYFLAETGGLLATTIAKIVLMLGALAVTFFSAKRLGGTIPALISLSAFLPLIGERNSERPEVFAFFLFALLFFILFASRISTGKKMVAAPLIILLWTNLHISFVYGIFLIGAWALRLIKKSWRSKSALPVIATLLLALAATLINPNGLTGALYPLTVFSNFGYQVTENLDPITLFGILPDPFIPYFLFLTPVSLAIIAWAVMRKSGFSFLYAVFLIFALLGFIKIRNFPYVIFTGIPAISLALNNVWETTLEKIKNLKATIAGALAIANLSISGMAIAVAPPNLSIVESGKAGIDFFLKNNLPGNIFNNFDTGGYLDYRLYPAYKTFVDNRPEAFPKEFFAAYVALQKDPEIRENVFREYGINSIIFSRTDATSWARTFLSRIRIDPNWETAYLDDYLVILVRKIKLPLPSERTRVVL